MKIRVRVNSFTIADDKIAAMCPECRKATIIGREDCHCKTCKHFFAVGVDRDGVPFGAAYFDIEREEPISGVLLGDEPQSDVERYVRALERVNAAIGELTEAETELHELKRVVIGHMLDASVGKSIGGRS